MLLQSLKQNEAADFFDSDFRAHTSVQKVDNIRATCDDVVKCETIQKYWNYILSANANVSSVANGNIKQQ